MFKQLPKVIEEIILDYKAQLDNFEKFNRTLTQIKKDIKIEYLIPIMECNSGYLIRSVKYKNKKIERLSSVLCHCCGRDISETHDEYDIIEGINENVIDDQLHLIYQGIINDWYEEKYLKIDHYSNAEYKKICDVINNDFDNFIVDEDNIELLFNFDDIEDIDIEDIDIEDMTDEELMNFIQEIEVGINVENNMDMEEVD